MAWPLSLIAVPFFLVLPGFAWRGLLPAYRSQDEVEICFGWVLVSVILTSLLALALAVCGLFSVLRLCSGLALIALAGFGLRRWRGRRVPCQTGNPSRDLPFLLVVLGVALLLYLPPHEHIAGGWDPGVYVQTGANILRTGGINYRDPMFAALPMEEQRLFVHVRNGIPQRFPGFRIVEDHGLISPQFYHLYSCWLAIAQGLGGVRWALWFNPLLAVLALVAVFLTARTLFGRAAGYAAMLLLAGNVVQIWFARFSTSEMLVQFLTWAGLYLFTVHAEEAPRGYGALAGLCFGLALFAHISAVLLVLPLLAVVYVRHVWGLGRKDGALLLMLVALTGLALLYNRTVALRYFDLLRFARLLVRRHAALVGDAGCAALGLLLAGVHGREWCRRALTSRWTRLALVCLLAGLAGYALGLRPPIVAASRAARVLQGDSLNRLLSNATSLRDMAWWVTLPGVALAVGGGCLVAWQGLNRRNILCWLLVVVSALVFFHDRMIEPLYMFTLRRFVPVVIPGLALGIALALVRVGRGGWMRRSAACACGVAALAWPLARHAVIVGTADFRGLAGFCRQVAERVPANALVVCDGYWLAAPLHFLHGKTTLAVSDPTPEKCAGVHAALRRWAAAGRAR